MKGRLTLVPTPIGNLGDITLRAIEALKEADLILAEDTRTTGFLMKHLQLHKPLKAYHQHNEHKSTSEVLDAIEAGSKVALVSDAGTPGISDPGYLITREAIARGLEVTCLPGATAFVPALVCSGLPCSAFAFYGFLPQKKGRQTKLTELAKEKKTFILYESPFRLGKLLAELQTHLGPDRKASVSREISKIFEETKRGNLSELAAFYKEKQVKGEIVVVVEGSDKDTETGDTDIE